MLIQYKTSIIFISSKITGSRHDILIYLKNRQLYIIQRSIYIYNQLVIALCYSTVYLQTQSTTMQCQSSTLFNNLFIDTMKQCQLYVIQQSIYKHNQLVISLCYSSLFIDTINYNVVSKFYIIQQSIYRHNQLVIALHYSTIYLQTQSTSDSRDEDSTQNDVSSPSMHRGFSSDDNSGWKSETTETSEGNFFCWFLKL